MSKESDAVIEALRLRGLVPQAETQDQNPEKEMEALSEKCVLEILQERNVVRFHQLSAIRRTLFNLVKVFVKNKGSVSVGGIKRDIDSRCRQFVPVLITKLLNYGIISELRDGNQKITYHLNESKITTVLDYIEAYQKKYNV